MFLLLLFFLFLFFVVVREYDINPDLFDIVQSILKDRDVLQRFGARILVLRFELFGNCLARLCQSC